jgi:hypothetical protein
MVGAAVTVSERSASAGAAFTVTVNEAKACKPPGSVKLTVTTLEEPTSPLPGVQENVVVSG